MPSRAAGICGGIKPVPTPTPSSPGVCMRGPGGPCTFVATADGITGSLSERAKDQQEGECEGEDSV
jgi:hypothetical protein